MQHEECDFCSNPATRWRYPIRDYHLVMVSLASGRVKITENVGDWSACQECYRLIQSGDRAGLLRRSAQRLMTPSMPPEMLQAIRRIHDEFFAHRAGPPVRVEQGASDA